MPVYIITEIIDKKRLSEIAKERFGDLVKAVVDIEKNIMAIGGDLHSDEEAILLEEGSRQPHLWGINLYPHKSEHEWIEFDSVINLRPSQGNFSRGVDNPEARKKIKEIVDGLVK